MKKLEEIFELLDGIIPANAEKTIMYCRSEERRVGKECL